MGAKSVSHLLARKNSASGGDRIHCVAWHGRKASKHDFGDSRLCRFYYSSSFLLKANITQYTQICDVELECDGFLNYDRSTKFSGASTQEIARANQKLIEGPSAPK